MEADLPTAVPVALSAYGASSGGGIEVLRIESFDNTSVGDDLDEESAGVPMSDQVLYPAGKYLMLRDLRSGEATFLQRKDGGEVASKGMRSAGISSFCVAPSTKVIASCERLVPGTTAAGSDSDGKEKDVGGGAKRRSNTASDADGAAGATAARKRRYSARLTLHHVSTRAPVKTIDFRCGPTGVTSCAFTPDSKHVVTLAELEIGSHGASLHQHAGMIMTVWQWDTMKAVARLSIPKERIGRVLCAQAASGGAGERESNGPLSAMVISTSGPRHLKCWRVSPVSGGAAEAGDPPQPLQPADVSGETETKQRAKSYELVCASDLADDLSTPTVRRGVPAVTNVDHETFADHAWVTSAASKTDATAVQLVVACNPMWADSAEGGDGAHASGVSHGSSAAGSSMNSPARRRIIKGTIYVFDRASKVGATSPVALTDVLPLELPSVHARIECVRAFSDGFVVAGSGGLLTLFVTKRASDGGAARSFVRVAALAAEPLVAHSGLPPLAFSMVAVVEKPPRQGARAGGLRGHLVALANGGRLLQAHLADGIEGAGSGVGRLVASKSTTGTPGSPHTSARGGGAGMASGGAAGAGASVLPAFALSDVLPGGSHIGPVIAMDLCYSRPLLITAGSDHTVRLWNSSKHRCEITHPTPAEEVTSVALHPLGFTAAIAFRDRIRTYHVLIDALRLIDEVISRYDGVDLRIGTRGSESVWASAY